MSEIDRDASEYFEFLEGDIDPDSALLENYSVEDGDKLIDFLEFQGYERPTDFKLGREINETYDPDSPVLKYNEGSRKRVVSDTEAILAIFGLSSEEFERFKQEDYQ